MIAFYSNYGKDNSKMLNKYRLDIDLSVSEVDKLKNRLLDIDTRKISSFQSSFINRDLDFLDNINMLKLSRNSSVKIKSKLENNSVYTEPISMHTIRLIDKVNIISFDLNDILKALAFRHLHYEFGYSNLDIENNLKGNKLIIRNNPDSLIGMVNANIDSIELLKDFVISERSYINGNIMYDNFCNKIVVKDNTYNLVLASTFKIASLLCVTDISEQLFDLGIKYLPLGVNSEKAYFLLDKPLNEDIKIDLVLEIFGRRFRYRVKPDIERVWRSLSDDKN